MTPRQSDVCVVGAGYAGLAAAIELARAGREVVVLEARNRVGGRVWSREVAPGAVVDVGGQWIGPTQDAMYGLRSELGVETVPTHDEGEHLAVLGGKRYRFTGDVPRMNPLVLLDLGRAISRIERLARRVPTDAPWEAERAERWDAEPFGTWIRRNARSRRAREILSVFAEGLFAASPAAFSTLHALFYTASGTSFETLISTSGGAQQDRFVAGAQHIPLRWADELGDRIVLEAPVRRIAQSDDRVRVEADGTAVEARRAIVATPPTLAGRIGYDPPLPAGKDQLLQRLPAGSVVKGLAVYDEPFWRADGLSGQSVTPLQPVSFTFDNSPPGGSPGILLGFIEGDAARRLGALPEPERRTAVLDSLAASFGERAKRPETYLDLDWSAEPWTRGCYGAHFPTGVWTRYGPALRAPVGLLHWAGTETATRWMGYMDGAVGSGRRAAAEVLAALEERGSA